MIAYRGVVQILCRSVGIALCMFAFSPTISRANADCGAPPCAVTFEEVPAGTVWGIPNGDQPGDIVLVEDKIAMSVEAFRLAVVPNFFQATVEGNFGPFFPTTPLELNNIDVRFDFSSLGFAVDTVTLEFVELSGVGDFSVNDQPKVLIDDIVDLPADLGGGVTATVAQGLITLTGPIDSFQIGGQELGIDNITAIPEPATWAMLVLGALALSARRVRKSVRTKVSRVVG